MVNVLLSLWLVAVNPPDAGTASAPARPVALADFFQKPDRVETFEADVDGSLSPPSKKDRRPRVGMFLFSKQGKDLKPEDIQALGASWTSPAATPPQPRLLCAFNPDLALRFWRGQEWAAVVICFTCQQMIFYDARNQQLDGGRFNDFALTRRLYQEAVSPKPPVPY
ncbi:hypothetical protein JYK02_39000 [Corallococcus macrosporus]|uniref:Uncharacterized protein n=1 Tax=Corallococcus macrosporus TaxID=35 RepID=A0ABS3DQC4_9BACT|nr:hypothetical protein [Corallococcus macrosporus]MBN8233526.1 hypothetical protein [Corallococcus macrosporus]